MSETPLRRRPFHCFVSYASEDGALAQEIVRWLETAGLNVWYDKARLGAGATVLEELTRQVSECRAFLALVTEVALTKHYVKHEVDIAVDQQVTQSGFTLVAARCSPTLDISSRFPALKKLGWLTVPDGKLTLDAARQLLLSLTPEVGLRKESRHVFVSCGWGEADVPLTRRVCTFLAARDVRLVGDSTDQKHFGGEGHARIERIMAGCGGHLMVLPERRSATRTPEEIYRYFLAESAISARLRIPRRVFCASRNALPALLQAEAIEVCSETADAAIERELIELHDEVEPTAPYAFLASDYKKFPDRNAAARKILEHVLGMECWMGDDYKEDQLRESIIARVRHANLVFADLACEPDAGTNRLLPNVNTCIEAGVAMGAARPVFVSALDPTSFDPQVRDRTTQVPFLFRNHQVNWYGDSIEYLAVMHRLAMATRRRIMNVEVV